MPCLKQYECMQTRLEYDKLQAKYEALLAKYETLALASPTIARLLEESSYIRTRAGY